MAQKQYRIIQSTLSIGIGKIITIEQLDKQKTIQIDCLSKNLSFDVDKIDNDIFRLRNSHMTFTLKKI